MSAPTFPEAIALTQSLFDDFTPTPAAIANLQTPITDLVATENGARGFFVTVMGDSRPEVEILFSPPADSLITALHSSPDIVSDLLVKNLAMSSAMAMHHRRQQDEDNAAGSELVRSRTLKLITASQLSQTIEKAKSLQATIQTGTGNYTDFLQRWGYDQEQLQAIAQTLTAIV
jgi:hypothetical protein